MDLSRLKGALRVTATLCLAFSGCDHVDLDVAQPTPSGTAATPVPPFPFEAVGAAYVGVSGAYPYVLLYEEGFTCEDLTAEGQDSLSGVTYDSILILVGGWDVGAYPIFDVIGATGPYEIDGQAIAYMATRTGRTIDELVYARAGTFEVDQINEVFQTIKGTFSIEFEAGTLSGDFVIREYCDVY